MTKKKHFFDDDDDDDDDDDYGDEDAGGGTRALCGLMEVLDTMFYAYSALLACHLSLMIANAAQLHNILKCMNSNLNGDILTYNYIKNL